MKLTTDKDSGQLVYLIYSGVFHGLPERNRAWLLVVLVCNEKQALYDSGSGLWFCPLPKVLPTLVFPGLYVRRLIGDS